MLRLRSSLVLSLLLVSGGACRSEPDPASAPATAVEAEPPPPTPRHASAPLGFLEHLDASHTTVLYIGDSLPLLQRVARSKIAKKLVADPAVLTVMPAIPTQFVGLDRFIAGEQKWIPEAVVIGAADSSMPILVRFLRGALLITLCPAAASSADPSVRRMLPELQKLLLADVEAISVPSLVVWVQLAGAAEAAQAFEEVGGALGTAIPGATVERTPTSITLGLTLGDMVDRTQLLDLLVGMQVVTSPDDPLGARMADAALALRGQLSLALRDNQLVFAIGPTISTVDRTRRRVDELGAMFDADAPTMFAWATWDLRAMGPVAAEAAATVQRWRASPAGRTLLSADTEDLAGDLEDLHRTVSSTAPRGEARVDVTDVIRAELVERDAPPAEPLIKSEILRMVPADALYVGVDATRGLDDMIADALGRFEDRVSSNWMKAWAKDDADAEVRWDTISHAYYADLAGLRELVLRDARSIFAPPYAFVIARSDPPNTVTLTSPSLPDVTLPVPGLAIIGRPAKMPAALEWFDALGRETARGTFRVAGRAPPERLAVATIEDLSLGVPTHALRLDWLGAAAPGYGLAASEGGGLHAFAHGDWLVLSTSTALSKRILAGAGASTLAVEPDVVALARLDGGSLADAMLAAADAFEPHGGDLLSAARLLITLGRAVAEIESTTRDVDGARRTTFVLEFADAN